MHDTYINLFEVISHMHELSLLFFCFRWMPTPSLSQKVDRLKLESRVEIEGINNCRLLLLLNFGKRTESFPFITLWGWGSF